MLKLSKWLLNKCLPWQRQWQLNWYGSNQHTIIFLDKFFELSPKVDAVAVFVAKIRLFEISVGTFYPLGTFHETGNCSQ